MPQLSKPSIPGLIKPTPTKPRPAPLPAVLGDFRVLSDMPLDNTDHAYRVETTEGVCYDVTAKFGIDSHAIDAANRAPIADLIIGQGLQGHYYQIAASTSRSGSTDYNLHLARRRLLTVQYLLTSLGVPVGMAFGPQHMVWGEERAAFKGVADGTEGPGRFVIVRIGPGPEVIQKMLFAMPHVSTITSELVLHHNSALA